MRRVLLVLLLGLSLSALAEREARSQTNVVTQCVTTTVAGGTSDAITIPKLPCVPTTALLLLTATATNTTTAPTITPVGGVTQTIKRFDGTALAVGDMPAGAHQMLSNNGTNWFLFNPSKVGTGPFDNPATGYFLRFAPPPTDITSWLNTNNVAGANPYGYLGKAGQVVTATIYGDPAFVGASRTSDTPFPNVCCAMGVAAVTINDNAVHPQTAWSFYDSASRLPGAGALNNESDKFNLGTLVTTNPYTGNIDGQVGNWTFQCGGEPVAVGLVGTHCNFGLKIGPNGDDYVNCCALMFDAGLGTIQAIGMAVNQRILWDSDPSGINRAYVTSLAHTNGSENAMIFTDFGAFFYQGTAAYVGGNGGVTGVIANNPSVSVVNHLAMQGNSSGFQPQIFAQGDDPNVSIALRPQIANANNANGDVVMFGPTRFQTTTVAMLPTCTISIVYQMYTVIDGNANLGFRSTTFTGGGTAPGIVLCNGSAWEWH